MQNLISDVALGNTFKTCQDIASMEAMFSHLGH